MTASWPADAALRAALQRWVEPLRRRSGAWPADLQPVTSRLVRSVGRGVLPDGTPVFVKWMTFPRGKDRARYLHRALPAVHEARLLERVGHAGGGVVAPEVLAVIAERAGPWPLLSVLVTRGLPVREDVSPSVADVARAAAELAARGIEHRDLHLGNVVSLAGGGLGVLDLQSARTPRGGVDRRARVAMATRLWASSWSSGSGEVLAEAGLVDRADLDEVLRRAADERRRAVVRRIRRCLGTSTQFHRRRSPGAVVHRRRAAPAELVAVDVGRAGRRLWLGDRACEVLDGAPPVLAALSRAAPWRRLAGGDRVFVAASTGAAVRFAAERARLEQGHARFLALCSDSGEPPGPPRA